MPEQNCAVILAAGEGKRMKSTRPKVLSPVLFKPMLQWVLDAVEEAGLGSACVVTGHMHEAVEEYLAAAQKPEGPLLSHVLQAERRGTGHAVMMAEDFLRRHLGENVLILNGDAPFVSAQVIRDTLRVHTRHHNAVTVVTAELDDPAGYGRIVRDPGTRLIHAIVEQKDADEKTRAIREINSGAYWFRVDALLEILHCIKNDNAQGEYYLTDAIKLLIERGKPAGAFTAADPVTVLGANDCLQLNALNGIARGAILRAHMENGVEIPCFDGVMIGPDVTIGSGSCVLPGTILRGGTCVGPGCTLGPNLLLTDCRVEAGVSLRFSCLEGQTVT